MTWEQVPLGRIIERFEAGVSVRSQDRPASNGEHGVLKVSCVSPLGFRPFENKVVLPEELSRLGPSPRRGDVLLTRANTVELVAMAVTVDRDYPTLHLSDKHWRVVLSNPQEDSLGWVKHVVNSTTVRRALVSRATGTSGSMKNVSQEEFLKIRVVRPPGDAQQRIAAVLDEFDDAHRELEALVYAKRRLKRALAQQLLTGKRRFKAFGSGTDTKPSAFGPIPSSWAYPRVDEIAHEVTERAGSGFAEFAVVSCSKHRGLVDSEEYFGKRVFSSERANYKVVRAGQFAYPSNHLEEGSIGLLQHRKVAVVSPIYTVFEASEQVVPEFLFALFKTHQSRQMFAARTNASVNRRGSMRWKQFGTLHVPLPPKPEQGQIASILAELDREIDLLERLRGSLEMQRRGVAELLLN